MFLQKNKRYLTGIDWIVHTLDYASKKETGIGNISQIVLELKGCLSENNLHSRLEKFVAGFTVMQGRCMRDYNLAPYWKIPVVKDKPCFSFEAVYLKSYDSAKIFSLLEARLNIPFKNNNDYVSFYLVSTNERSFLVMTFDHRVFDARGAEAFLGMFEENNLKDVFLSEPAHLCQWRQKFEAGKCVNRRFSSLAQGAPPRVLNRPLNSKEKNFKFKMITFDQEVSKAIIDNAYEKAGYLLFMPYALALILKRIHKLFCDREASGNDYIVSVSVDTRKLDDVFSQMFFNHLSFLFFRINTQEAEDFDRLLSAIKRQMYKQVKDNFAQNFSQASLLMRIVPLPILYKIMKLYFRGETSSLSFSCLGNSAYVHKHFMGLEVKNIFHMPRVPVPPGIGVFLNQFQGRINLVFSYLASLLNEEQAGAFIDDLRADLAQEKKYEKRM